MCAEGVLLVNLLVRSPQVLHALEAHMSKLAGAKCHTQLEVTEAKYLNKMSIELNISSIELMLSVMNLVAVTMIWE